MSSKIIPITKATANIKPPLKKSELVEALAIRELENIRVEQAEIAEQIKVTHKELYNPAIVELIRANGKPDHPRNQGEPFRINATYSGDRHEASSLDIGFSIPATPEVRRLYRKLKDLRKRQLHDLPSLHQLKQGISAKLSERASAGSRVAALLKNPETSKALDDTLAALKQPATLQIAG